MQKERGGKRVDKGGALFILAGSRPSPGNYTRKDDLDHEPEDEPEDELEDELEDSASDVWSGVAGRTRRRAKGR
jgi:hypothetical protein